MALGTLQELWSHLYSFFFIPFQLRVSWLETNAECEPLKLEHICGFSRLNFPANAVLQHKVSKAEHLRPKDIGLNLCPKVPQHLIDFTAAEFYCQNQTVQTEDISQFNKSTAKYPNSDLFQVSCVMGMLMSYHKVMFEQVIRLETATCYTWLYSWRRNLRREKTQSPRF